MEKSEIKTIKERYKNSKETHIKTHLTCESGIVNWYSAEELIKWYGDCDSQIVYYEKDYGDCHPAIREYLLIHSDINYDKEIMEERKNARNDL